MCSHDNGHPVRVCLGACMCVLNWASGACVSVTMGIWQNPDCQTCWLGVLHSIPLFIVVPYVRTRARVLGCTAQKHACGCESLAGCARSAHLRRQPCALHGAAAWPMAHRPPMPAAAWCAPDAEQPPKAQQHAQALAKRQVHVHGGVRQCLNQHRHRLRQRSTPPKALRVHMTHIRTQGKSAHTCVCVWTCM